MENYSPVTYSYVVIDLCYYKWAISTNPSLSVLGSSLFATG